MLVEPRRGASGILEKMQGTGGERKRKADWLALAAWVKRVRAVVMVREGRVTVVGAFEWVDRHDEDVSLGREQLL
jgi:hypothetical protein